MEKNKPVDIEEKYGKTHYIDKMPFADKTGRVDLTKLENNQSVCWGDGKTFYYRLTKKPVT